MLERTTLLGDGSPIAQRYTLFGLPLDTQGLAGTLDVAVSDHHADFFTRNRLAVRIEQDLRPVTRGYACWFEVPHHVLADVDHPAWQDTFEARMLGITAQWSIDRHLRPWTQWKVTPFPVVAPFRSLTMAQELGRRAIRAWELLRFDLPDQVRDHLLKGRIPSKR